MIHPLSNIKKILKPGCDNVQQKIQFFCLAEEWQNMALNATEKTLISQSFQAVRRSFEIPYYHTLLHLLSCGFCLDISEILMSKSHPDLWKLNVEHPGNYLNTVMETQSRSPQDEKARYFQLLYQKLVVPQRRGVLFQWIYADHIQQQVSIRKAAGTYEPIPPDITIPSELIPQEPEGLMLFFQWDPITGELNIGLRGGSVKTRLATRLTVFYHSGQDDSFSGEEIAIGGMWGIPREKAKNICRVDFSLQEKSVEYKTTEGNNK